MIVFALAVGLAASGFWMVHRFIESKEQKNSFHELAEAVLLEKPSIPAQSEPDEDQEPVQEPPAGEPVRHGPEVLHDIAALREKNADALGWIRVPDTVINYPLMWTPDQPEKYLHLDFQGAYSDYGVPFLDARCTLDSANLILYGHNMYDGSMFAGLHKYLDADYLDAHRQIILETADGGREYRAFIVCRANVQTSGIYKYIDEPSEFLDAVRSDSMIFTEPDKSAKHFITLSTCGGWNRSERVVVIGEEIT